jgi:hypothetical protein
MHTAAPELLAALKAARAALAHTKGAFTIGGLMTAIDAAIAAAEGK